MLESDTVLQQVSTALKNQHHDQSSIGQSIERSVEYIVPLLDDKLGVIGNVDNPGLRRLQQEAISFHDTMDDSFPVVYRGVILYYHLAWYFGTANHSAVDQMKAQSTVKALGVEVKKRFQGFTNHLNRLNALFEDEKNFHPKHRPLVMGENPAEKYVGARMVEWIKADVDFKYSKDTPTTYTQLTGCIRDHNTIIASCKILSTWWKHYVVLCKKLSYTPPEDTSFLSSDRRRRYLELLADHLFPYIHQMVPTITSTKERLPGRYSQCRGLIQTARLDLWRSDIRTIGHLPPSRWDLRQLQMNSLTMICQPVALEIEGEKFIHHLEARITDVEHYKNDDYGLKVRVLPRVRPCPIVTVPAKQESTKKPPLKIRNRSYRCAFLRIILSFNQTLKKPSITGFAPTSSTSNSTDHKITNKDFVKLAPAAKGFRLGELGMESTTEDTHSFYAQAEGVCIGSLCEWSMIENQALKTTIGESHLGVTLGLGALDPTAETSIDATIIATYEYTWEEKERSMLVRRKWVSKKKTEVKTVKGATTLPFPLLTRLGLVTETDNSKTLLESCALIPPRKL
ncbi:hypothetical protein BJ165DRAFT_1508770 [Panaeolus papilionaceus]|nr:hypothetical protein BJ165DRAFT_1508770 [Panaeolus papilionaceus]